MRVVNEGKEVVPMYWWSNIAVPEYEKGKSDRTGSSGVYIQRKSGYKVDIPVVEGIDVCPTTKL